MTWLQITFDGKTKKKVIILTIILWEFKSCANHNSSQHHKRRWRLCLGNLRQKKWLDINQRTTSSLKLCMLYFFVTIFLITLIQGEMSMCLIYYKVWLDLLQMLLFCFFFFIVVDLISQESSQIVKHGIGPMWYGSVITTKFRKDVCNGEIVFVQWALEYVKEFNFLTHGINQFISCAATDTL